MLGTFTESETAVLAALSHFAQPAKVKWIADFAGIAEPAALTALEDLTDRALLLSAEGTLAFLLPPLAATFLRRKRPEIIARTGGRLTDRVYALVLENGDYNYERFSTLEAQWPSIAAALPLLMQGENDRLQQVCSALSTFLDFSGRWDEQLSLSQQAEEKALAATDTYHAGWRALNAGWIYQLRGQATEVLASATRASAHWEKASQIGVHERGTVLFRLGGGYTLLKNYPAAIEAYQEALTLGLAIAPESLAVASALNLVAIVKRLQGDYASAEHDFREALRIAKKLNSREGISIYTGNLAELALDRGDWTAGEALARESLDVAEEVGRQEVIGDACSKLATALARQGRAHEGLPYAHRAAEILTRLRQSDELGKALAALNECGG